MLRSVRSFDRFHIKIADAILFAYRRITTIRKRTRTAEAKTAYIVRILTKSVFLGDFTFKATELVVDYIPYNRVVLHVSFRALDDSDDQL